MIIFLWSEYLKPGRRNPIDQINHFISYYYQIYLEKMIFKVLVKIVKIAIIKPANTSSSE